MPFSAFCKIEGIEGNSKVIGFENQIELISFNHSITQPVSAPGGGGPGQSAGKANHQEFQIVKSMDKASPVLMRYLLSGRHIGKVEMTVCRATEGNPVPYIKYNFEDVIISSYQPDGAFNGERPPPEKVSFTYSRIEMTYADT